MEQPNKGNTAPSHYRFGCQQPVQFLDLPLPVLSPPQSQLLVALIQQRFLTADAAYLSTTVSRAVVE